MSRRSSSDSRCRSCGSEVIWATLDHTATRPGRRICVDLYPVESGGTIEIYWMPGNKGERMARVYPRGAADKPCMRRPHFATCPATSSVTAGAA